MSENGRTLAITGPTGNVGSHLTRLLIQAGARPRLLAHDAAKLDPELRDHVEVREGDQTDPEFVREATAGVDALHWIVPEEFSSPDPLAASRTMAENVAAAVEANGISHVVLQSSVGAELREGVGMIDGLAANEERLGTVAPNLAVLRCGFFFSNLLASLDQLREGVFATTKPLDDSMPWVDPRDIAEVVAARLLNPDWSGRVVQAVHGPADLSSRQVAEILTAALGREVSATLIDDDEFRAGLLASGQFSEAGADAMVQMTSGQPPDFRPEQERSLLSTTPTTLGEWAYANLRPALEGGAK